MPSLLRKGHSSTSFATGDSGVSNVHRSEDATHAMKGRAWSEPSLSQIEVSTEELMTVVWD
jgi:hypothetical protein